MHCPGTRAGSRRQRGIQRGVQAAAFPRGFPPAASVRVGRCWEKGEMGSSGRRRGMIRFARLDCGLRAATARRQPPGHIARSAGLSPSAPYSLGLPSPAHHHARRHRSSGRRRLSIRRPPSPVHTLSIRRPWPRSIFPEFSTPPDFDPPLAARHRRRSIFPAVGRAPTSLPWPC